MTINNITRTVKSVFTNWEVSKFFIFLFLFIGLSIRLMNMISSSWNTKLMGSISASIRAIDSSGISMFIAFMIGFYAGSAILLWNDKKKKAQSLILFGGVISIFIYMVTYFNVGWNIIYIIAGIALSLILGGVRSINSLTYTPKSQNVVINVGIFSIVYLLTSLVILYVSTDLKITNFFIDAASIVLFAFIFGQLMSYEMKDSKIFILGPKRSGKTQFIIGCFLSIEQRATTPIVRNDTMIELVEKFKTPNKDTGIYEWTPRTTQTDMKEYYFTFESNLIFPKQTTMKLTDYPGSHLEHIPLGIDKILNPNNPEIDDKINKIKDINFDYVKETAKNVLAADTLVFIIDSDRCPNFNEMEIGNYDKIISRLIKQGKQFNALIVVTKCDIWQEEFKKSHEQSFRKYITEKFSKNKSVKQLKTKCSCEDFYPVYFYTTTVKDIITGATIINGDTLKPERIPLFDDYGNPNNYGFNELMNVLTESNSW